MVWINLHLVKLLPPRGGEGPSSFCLQTLNKVLMSDHERPGNVQLIFNQQGKNGEVLKIWVTSLDNCFIFRVYFELTG
jgi:hypothetical protein